MLRAVDSKPTPAVKANPLIHIPLYFGASRETSSRIIKKIVLICDFLQTNTK